MPDHRGDHEADPGTWEGARRAHLRSALAATPAQRLDWLEAALEVAHASGALARRREEIAAAGDGWNSGPPIHDEPDVE